MQQILKQKDKIVILADFRENSSGVQDLIRDLGADIKESSLKVGDYICSDRVCVERKTAEDFVNSIIDGRLFNQLEELKQNFQKPVIVIEGNNFRDTVNENAIKSAMASVILDYEVPVVMTKDKDDTAKIIYWLSKREQIKSKRPVGFKGKKKPKEIKKLQEHIISGFPGVSEKISKRILKEFGSIKNFANASEEEIRKVEGIGKKLSSKLHGIINKKYVD